MNTPADFRPPLLVIDDDVEEAEQLCRFFDGLGADATLALGAVSAAQLLKTVEPAIVLVVGPRLAGDDNRSVLAWLRRQDDEFARPFYVCCGHGVEQRERTGDDDFDLFMDLPVSPELARDLVRIAQHKHLQLQQVRGRPPAAPALRPR
jgi:CheY-like chemotaxis protein